DWSSDLYPPVGEVGGGWRHRPIPLAHCAGIGGEIGPCAGAAPPLHIPPPPGGGIGGKIGQGPGAAPPLHIAPPSEDPISLRPESATNRGHEAKGVSCEHPLGAGHGVGKNLDSLGCGWAVW